MKIGRNDLCICGSGKKYKKCHRDVPPLEVYKEWALKNMAKGAEEDRRWKEQFGDLRQPIWIDHEGYRLLVAGNSITPAKLKNKKNRYFADVLSPFLEGAFGSEWGTAELAKPFEEQHVIVQWRTRALTYMSKLPKNDAGVYGTFLTGAMSAYFCLAYDLFTVQDNGRLDVDLMQRLKHPGQFQGARHELFAEATCLRAGFKIEHEDERDRLKRHAEFIATHKKTGQKVSVEAKSKHRSGVLGRPGQPPDPKECDLSFGQLLNDAIAKNPPYSLVVFLDTNVPPETAKYFFRQDEKGIPSKINALLERVKKHHKGVDLINLAVFTNLPHHYAEGNELDPPKNLIAVRSDRAKIPAQHPEAIWAIAEAANLYGHIPKELPTRND